MLSNDSATEEIHARPGSLRTVLRVANPAPMVTALMVTALMVTGLSLSGCSGFSLLSPEPPPPLDTEPLVQGVPSLVESIELIQDEAEAELRIAAQTGVSFEEVERNDDRIVLSAINVELDPSVGTLETTDGLVARVEVESSQQGGLAVATVSVFSRRAAAFNVVQGIDGNASEGLRVFMASKVDVETDGSSEAAQTPGERVVAEAIPIPVAKEVPVQFPSAVPVVRSDTVEPAFTESQPGPALDEARIEAAAQETTARETTTREPVEAVAELVEDPQFFQQKEPIASAIASESSDEGEGFQPSRVTLSQLSPAAAMRAAEAVAPGTPASPTVSAPLSSEPATRVEALELAPLGADAIYRIQGDGQFSYKTFMLPDPLRFVIDLEGVVDAVPEDVLPANRGAIERVRIGQFQRPPEAVARVVFDMSQPGVPLIERDSTGLSIRFVPEPNASALADGETGSRVATSEAGPEQPAVLPEPARERVTMADTPAQELEIAQARAPATRENDTVAESSLAPQPGDPVVVDSPEGFRVVRRHAEALGRRDLSSLLADVAEGVEWFTVVGSETVLVSRGREGFLVAMKDRFANEDAKIEIGDITDNGRFVTLKEKRIWTNSAGQETVSTTLSVFELDQGKIVRFWNYPGQ